MCNKYVFEAIVTCKKCRHLAHVYRNPKVGVRKDRKGASAIVFKDEKPSPEFCYWVTVVCKKCNTSTTLTEKDFKEINPPCCCKQKMNPKKTDLFYFYKCEICGKTTLLANLCELLPDSIKIAKK